MSRIRSVKPEFFTSETIASLPLSARLTFIGLWTYVDDNGVGLDNEMLINASIWPLEEDPLDTLARTREDLATLSRKRLVTRYRDSRKRYLLVTSWDEHQKVDHPRKPRYPRPDEPGCEPVATCDNTDPDEGIATSSRHPREDVAPDQGSGIRDQGSGKNTPRNADVGSDRDPDFTTFWDVYPRVGRARTKAGKGQARTAWRKAVLTDHADPKDIIAAAERFRDFHAEARTETRFIPYASTWLNGECYNEDPAENSGEAPEDDENFWSS